MITVSHITKRFGTVAAVHDVSFSIERGEVVGLLGPNGAGKTTTMRIMTGYYTPDEGSVTVNDLSVADDPIAARKEIGYLPESNPLYKDLLVGEYLHFIARLREVPPSTYASQCDRVVHDTGIEEVFYRPIHELSKGYRQRVGLAGALIGDPSVLILDEPTEGLDPNQRNDMRTLLARLAKEKTILVSTHVLSEVQATADRIIVLNGGTVAAQGTIADLTHAHTVARYTVELSGKDTSSILRALPTVEQVEVESQDDERLLCTVYTNQADAFTRELSGLIGKHHWVLWRMVPESGGLERAFMELTLNTPTSSHNA